MTTPIPESLTEPACVMAGCCQGALIRQQAIEATVLNVMDTRVEPPPMTFAERSGRVVGLIVVMFMTIAALWGVGWAVYFIATHLPF